VIEIQEQVYPGEYVTFWVFAPLGSANGAPARLPSPTIRVEEGDIVYVTLHNTHYLPHTIHFHGMAQENIMDGVPDMNQHAVPPGGAFTYRFVAKTPGTYWYHCHVQDQIHPLMGLAGMIIVEPNRPNNHFATSSRRRPDRADGQGDRRAVPGRVLARVHGRGRPAQPHPGRNPRPARDRAAHVPRLRLDPAQAEHLPAQRPQLPVHGARHADPGAAGRDHEAAHPHVGGRTLALHTHGHHPTLTDLDGYPVPQAAQITRDTFAVAPAQRIDSRCAPARTDIMRAARACG